MSKKSVVNESVEAEVATEADIAESDSAIKQSRFWALYEEAMEDDVESEPYTLDIDPKNPILIPKPETTDQVLSLASIIDKDGDVAIDEIKPMLKAFLGDLYNKVYEKQLAKFKLPVTLAVINDMNDFWFSKDLAEQAKGLPGGSGDSSS